MEIYYAGIGSRETPEDVCRKMFKTGRALAQLNYVLRSGGAAGADRAFEAGCDAGNGIKQIYLPYKRFNANESPYFGTTKAARAIAKKYHPNWTVLSCLGRDFMGRNVYQLLGSDLSTPVQFILCWTPNGRITGGTGQALRMAEDYKIPIFNFAVTDDDTISDFILSLRKG